MTTAPRFVLVLLALATTLLLPVSARAQEPMTAFVDVNIIPMDRERVLTGQTVLVRGSRIAAIGRVGHVKIPAEAVRVDGQGKFLIPGMADMHVHVSPLSASGLTDNGLTDKAQNYKDAPGAALLLYLANGITTLRNMYGDTNALKLRDRVARGELLGPRIYTAGPYVGAGTSEGPLMPTPEIAKQIVAEQKAAGYDFIKLHGLTTTPETFDTFAMAAKRAKMPFAGHTPSVGLARMIQAHPASVEHLNGYIYYLAGLDSDELKQRYNDLDSVLSLADESKIPVLAARLKQAGVWSCPTLIVMKQESLMEDSLAALGKDHPRFAHRTVALRGKIVKGLHDAGAGLLLGTDGPGGYGGLQIRPISEIQVELGMLVDAGLTRYQALETSTRNVAAFLGTLDSTGTVAVGKRADLVLLPGNPLTDLNYTGRPAGVMLGGRWFSRADLKARLTAAGIPDTWYPK